MRAYNILDIACYIVNKSYKSKYGVTVGRLQMLLVILNYKYYLKYNKVCFKDIVEFKDFGVTIRRVYDEFSVYGGDRIPQMYKHYYLDYTLWVYKEIDYNESVLDVALCNIINNLLIETQDMDNYCLNGCIQRYKIKYIEDIQT